MGKKTSTGDEMYTMQLSFIEMHFLIKAMEAYNSRGYGGLNSTPASEGHQAGAEALHNELLDLYTTK